MLGRRGGIDPELQDRFAQSGLVHLLSISGFHVGLIGAWVFLVARLLRARREPALIIAALASTAYVGVPRLARAGHPGGGAGRWCSPAAACASGTCGPTSCSSATCLGGAADRSLGGARPRRLALGRGALGRDALQPLDRRARSGRSFGWRTLGSSVGATLATAPITAWALGTVAPVGVAPQLRGHSDRGRRGARACW